MAEVPTHFPPQTYSSSFFLNAIPEDDKVGNKIKVKNKDEPSQSSPILDCFMKTMISIFVLGFLPVTMAIQCTLVIPSETKVRLFPTLSSYQGNSITFDPVKHEFEGNFIKIKTVPAVLAKNSFVAYESDYAIRLMLDHAGIRTLSDGAFLQLFCLESLDLQANAIDTIEPNALQGLPHLRYLNLSRNSLQSLPVNVFDNMTHLKSLDLSFNKMQTFDCTLRNLRWLTHLNLSHNYLSTIDFNRWELHQLQALDVTYNDITHIDPWVEFSYGNMSRLLLAHNLLKKLNIFAIRKMAPKLAELTLEENSWSCDVLRSMTKALHDSSITYQGHNKTNSHVDGIDCVDHEVVISSTTTTILAPVVTSSPLIQNLTNMVNNEEVLRAISDLKAAVVCLFTLFIIFVIFEVALRTGFAGKVLGRFKRGDEVLFDNGSVENIRLLPGSNRL